MMRDITALGGTAVLTLGVLAVTGFLALMRKTHAAVTVLVSVVSGMVLSQAIKWAYARPRPELVPHGMETYSASFPSGHSMMAAVVYLTLGALLARHQAQPRMRVYVLLVAVLLTVLVGISRVYLGVHWPTDVLAGWCLGAAWAILCWFAMLWLQRRGTVEQAAEGSG
jgi:undecaprenyl-diphosphatase